MAKQRKQSEAKTFTSMMVIATMIAFSGCAVARYTPPLGAIYSQVKGVAPSTQAVVTDGTRTGSKSGQACAKGLLGVAAWGDMSLATAKRNGGITKVDTLDYSTRNILGVWMKNCTVITGE